MTDWERHYRAVGVLVTNFGALESIVAFWVGGLIDENGQIGSVVTAQLPFGKALVVADGLFRIRCQDGAVCDSFHRILVAAGKCEQKRNQIIHSAWVGYGGPQFRVKCSAKMGRPVKVTAEETTSEKIESVAGEIATVTKALTSFAIEHRAFHFIPVKAGPMDETRDDLDPPDGHRVAIFTDLPPSG
jgi:hypothetical protein